MYHNISRNSMTALALAASLCLSATNAFAAPLQQQTQPDQKPAAQNKPAAQKTPASKTNTAPQQKPANAQLPSDKDPDQIGKRNINKGIIGKHSGSLEKEVAVGRQFAAEIDKESKFIDDPVITEYVNRVGQNLVLHSDAKVPFTIKVIDSDEVNAFALPGGFFYVNKGLILVADNEAELAGAMAHEIAHVAARHAMENQTKATLAQYGAIAATILTGGIAGEIIYNAAGFLLPVTFLKFNRSAEQEADSLGVQYMYAAGYDPNAMSTMFEKLLAKNKKKPGTISKMFSSHPQTADRIEASRSLVAQFPEHEEYLMSTSEFQRVKARLLRLSNARATTAGNIKSDDDNAPGRPTLKRRQPAGDDNSTTTPGSTDSDKPTDSTKPSGPPTMKRRDGSGSTRTPAPTMTTAPAGSTPPLNPKP
jgi:predicted Zn-dependent protease